MVTIQGTVREKFTWRPISNATVSANLTAVTKTDKFGRFTLAGLPPTGMVSLTASAPEHESGHREFKPRLPIVEDVELVLTPLAKLLDKSLGD